MEDQVQWPQRLCFDNVTILDISQTVYRWVQVLIITITLKHIATLRLKFHFWTVSKMKIHRLQFLFHASPVRLSPLCFRDHPCAWSMSKIEKNMYNISNVNQCKPMYCTETVKVPSFKLPEEDRTQDLSCKCDLLATLCDIKMESLTELKASSKLMLASGKLHC